MWRSIIEVILTILIATFVIVLFGIIYSIFTIWIICICGLALMASLSDWYYSNDDKIVDDVDPVVIVKVVKPRHERPHEVVDLSSESDGEEEIIRKTRRRSKKLNL